MKTRKLIYVLFISVIIFSCTELKKKGQNYTSKEEIVETWEDFLDILEKKDKDKFKIISSKNIHCYICLENTSDEQIQLETKRNNDPDWYNKIYSDEIYIPIDRFLTEDFDLIFNAKFVLIISSNETSFHKREMDGIDYYEVLVVTTEASLEHDGGQHNFQFIKENGKWLFNEIGTIP